MFESPEEELLFCFSLHPNAQVSLQSNVFSQLQSPTLFAYVFPKDPNVFRILLLLKHEPVDEFL